MIETLYIYYELDLLKLYEHIFSVFHEANMIDKTVLHVFAALCCFIYDRTLENVVDGMSHTGKIKYNENNLDYEPLDRHYEYSSELKNAKRTSGSLVEL